MRWRYKMMQPWSSPFCISSLNKTHWCCTSLHSWNSTRWQNRSCIDPNKAIDGICKQWNGWWKSWPIPWVKFNSLNYETSWVWWIYPSLKTRLQIQRVHNLCLITWRILQVFNTIVQTFCLIFTLISFLGHA
jgi:hypothetical protein